MRSLAEWIDTGPIMDVLPILFVAGVIIMLVVIFLIFIGSGGNWRYHP